MKRIRLNTGQGIKKGGSKKPRHRRKTPWPTAPTEPMSWKDL